MTVTLTHEGVKFVGRDYFLDMISPQDFRAKDLRQNEVHLGEGQVMVKIPDLPGRIGKRKRDDQYGAPTYIELILNRYYDAEKRQSRNKRIIIGQDFSEAYQGMMIPNDKYYHYFDHDGHPRYSEEFPEEISKRRKADSATEPDDDDQTERTEETASEEKIDVTILQGGTAETEETIEEKTEETKETAEEETEEAAEEEKTEEKEEETNEPKRSSSTLEIIEEEIDEDEDEVDEEPEHKRIWGMMEKVRRKNEELARSKNEEMLRIVEYSEQEKARIRFLEAMFYRYKKAVNFISEKKLNTPMTDYQIRRINSLLREAKETFRGYENEEYLELAEEPNENEEDGEKKSNITYGDMIILLEAYSEFFTSFNNKKLRRKQPQE